MLQYLAARNHCFAAQNLCFAALNLCCLREIFVCYSKPTLAARNLKLAAQRQPHFAAQNLCFGCSQPMFHRSKPIFAAVIVACGLRLIISPHRPQHIVKVTRPPSPCTRFQRAGAGPGPHRSHCGLVSASLSLAH